MQIKDREDAKQAKKDAKQKAIDDKLAARAAEVEALKNAKAAEKQAKQDAKLAAIEKKKQVQLQKVGWAREWKWLTEWPDDDCSNDEKWVHPERRRSNAARPSPHPLHHHLTSRSTPTHNTFDSTPRTNQPTNQPQIQDKADAEKAKKDAQLKAVEDKKEMARLQKEGKVKEAEEKKQKMKEDREKAAEEKKQKAADAKQAKVKAAAEKAELAKAAKIVRDEERKKQREEDALNKVGGWENFTYKSTLYSRIAYRQVQIQYLQYKVTTFKKKMGEEVYEAFARSDTKEAERSFQACKKSVDELASELRLKELDLSDLYTKGESEYAAIKKPVPPAQQQKDE